jgi:acetylornithine deacetylase/succinyl-diaminopimelate desuccinylase family protein
MDLEQRHNRGGSMTKRSEEVLATLGDLVSINSINPAYENGVPEEGVATYFESFFRERGIETFRQHVMPGRANVVARLSGRNPGRRIVMEAHMDTASITGMTIPPFEPTVKNGLLYGRGSCDTKAGLAAMMHAISELKENSVTPPCEVWLAAAVDEEYMFRGVVALCEGLQADAAIVAEPTELRAIIASKGVLRWKVRTRGKAAHSSKPHLGVNAISQMAKIITALDREAEALGKKTHPLLGPGTLNVGVIHGGVQVNFVPDVCEIEIDRRLLPGETPEIVLKHHEGILNELRSHDPSMQIETDPPMLADPALETEASAQVCRVASEVLANLGLNGELAGVPYGSDASKLSRHGVPSIIFGPGSIDRAHAAVEYVECDQVVSAVSFYREFLLRFE